MVDMAEPVRSLEKHRPVAAGRHGDPGAVQDLQNLMV
jgi:hypothetical protein